MRGICAALLLLLLAGYQVAAQGPGGYRVKFSEATAGRASGSVLVLDVSSLWNKHPTQPQISTQDAAECQRRCAKLPGCTGYAFCKDAKGCGTGCAAHVSKNPGVSATILEATAAPKRGERDTSTTAAPTRGERGDTTAAAPSTSSTPGGLSLPLNSFGPFTPHTASKGCQPGAPDKWAFGTCTLLKATGQDKMAPAAESAGWVSGWLIAFVPPQCAGLSAAACDACTTRSPDSFACLNCMTDTRARSYVDKLSLIGDAAAEGSVGSRTLDQCISCAGLKDKAAQRKCVECVLGGQPCGACIPYPGSITQLPSAALAPCMSCIEAKGRRFAGTCITCSSSSNPTSCISCLSSFYPRFICKSSEYSDCYKPDFDNPCATCQATGANFNACVACYQQPKAKVDCESCATLTTPSAQAACFNCSAKSPPAASSAPNTPGGCGLCFARSKDASTLRQCLDCLTDAGTTPEKRGACSLCASSELTPQQSQACFKCVEGGSGSSSSGGKSGSGCATCAVAASAPAAFQSCMACRANNSANGPDCHDCESLGVGLAPAAADALRKRCWDCVVASKLVVPADAGSAPLGSCSSCFASSSSGSSSSVDVAACVACNTSPLVPTAAKGWCISCATKATAGQREGCLKCLQGKALGSAKEYQAKCST